MGAHNRPRTQGRIRNVSPKVARTDPDTGRVFDSKREMMRYHELRMREMAGDITHLSLQPVFTLLPKTTTKRTTIRAITYRLDFTYFETTTGEWVAEDVKGYATEVYRIKRKLFEAYYPNYEFREVK